MYTVNEFFYADCKGKTLNRSACLCNRTTGFIVSMKSPRIKKGIINTEMKRKKLLRSLIITLLIALNIGCDQISKSVVRDNVNYYEKIELVNEKVILTKVENTGAFLGVGQNLPEPVRMVLFLAMPFAVMMILLFVLFRRKMNRLALIGLTFVIGGGLGNLYDRVMHGSVTDFLHINLGFFKTGIFNMADLSIMIGISILMYFNLAGNRRKTATTE